VLRKGLVGESDFRKMETLKNIWQKSTETTANPQSVDYARVTRRSVIAVAGFTIIEVLIVLAIAGLILLIVFLAVPALQRNSRNTGRKEDAGRLDGAVHNFASNNSTGAFPTQANWAAGSNQCSTIETDAGNLNQYSSLTCVATAPPAAPAGFYEVDSGAVIGGASVAANAVILSEQTICDASTSSNNDTTATGASSRTAALLYSLESGGSTWNWACINIQ
jgi:prepilin-type N-terminal cleavage/methylation domain-containing protein